MIGLMSIKLLRNKSEIFKKPRIKSNVVIIDV